MKTLIFFKIFFSLLILSSCVSQKINNDTDVYNYILNSFIDDYHFSQEEKSLKKEIIIIKKSDIFKFTTNFVKEILSDSIFFSCQNLLHLKNEKPVLLEIKDRKYKSFQIITIADWSEVTIESPTDEGFWKEFYEVFGQNLGIIQFSVPYYYEPKNLIFVYYHHIRSSLGGIGIYVVIELSSSRRIKSVYEKIAWVS